MYTSNKEYTLNGKTIQGTVYSKSETPQLEDYDDVSSFMGSDGDTVYVTNDADAAKSLIALLDQYNFDFVLDNYDLDGIQMIQVGELHIFLMITDGLCDAAGESIMPKELEEKFVLFGADVDDVTILGCLGALREGGEDALELAEDWIERLYEYMPGPTSLVDDILIEFNKNADDWIAEFDMDYSE